MILNKSMRRIGLVVLLGATQSGCIVVGYTSNGGWFFWPGGLGLLLMIVVLLLLFRRGS